PVPVSETSGVATYQQDADVVPTGRVHRSLPQVVDGDVVIARFSDDALHLLQRNQVGQPVAAHQPGTGPRLGVLAHVRHDGRVAAAAQRLGDVVRRDRTAVLSRR